MDEKPEIKRGSMVIITGFPHSVWRVDMRRGDLVELSRPGKARRRLRIARHARDVEIANATIAAEVGRG